MENDTICAISTAVGTGAISIIRCSGPNAITIVNSFFKGKDLTKVESHTINYGYIFDGKELIDEVLVSIMKAPKTFTKEDIVEINSHGGITTTNKILELLLLNGCRLAEPGEFTKRAFLNGRIDLIEAEAVGDIISAESEKARKLAINQIKGNVTEIIDNIRQDILTLQSEIEVNIDYPEYEEAEEYTLKTIKPKLEGIKKSLINLLLKSQDCQIIKNGINIALIGKPNVGKSSILNTFLNENKAIVTNIPGTTRDIIEGHVTLKGIALNFLDTAGIRATKNEVEKIGVEKSYNAIKNADLIIYVMDYNQNVNSEDLEFLKNINDKKLIIFMNKNDLQQKAEISELKNYKVVYGNTITEEGIESLKETIIELFSLKEIETSDYTFLSNARQISLVKKSLQSIENGINNVENLLPIDMYTIDLKEAYDYLGEIIGETYNDDLLDEMFKNFCLGK